MEGHELKENPRNLGGSFQALCMKKGSKHKNIFNCFLKKPPGHVCFPFFHFCDFQKLMVVQVYIKEKLYKYVYIYKLYILNVSNNYIKIDKLNMDIHLSLPLVKQKHAIKSAGCSPSVFTPSCINPGFLLCFRCPLYLQSLASLAFTYIGVMGPLRYNISGF